MTFKQALNDFLRKGCYLSSQKLLVEQHLRSLKHVSHNWTLISRFPLKIVKAFPTFCLQVRVPPHPQYKYLGFLLCNAMLSQIQNPSKKPVPHCWSNIGIYFRYLSWTTPKLTLFLFAGTLRNWAYCRCLLAPYVTGLIAAVCWHLT